MLRCSATMAATLRKSPLPFNAFDSTIPFSPKAISSLRRTASCLGEKRFSAPRFPPRSLRGFPNSSCGVGFGRVGFGFAKLRAVSDGGGFGGYLMALDKYPVTTKAITSAILTLVGDLICQLLIDQVSKLDLKRTFVFTLLGLVLVGPTLHIWYLYLSKLVTASGASGAFVRLLLDQFIFSPIFIGVFMSLLVTLEGRPSLVVPKLQQEWFSSVLANWQLWIPFQFLNFYFVPQKFQVLAANFVALAWNVILSFKAHKEVVLK
ncbi:Protein Mpv17 [Ananas comosus]|uniref:Protein Mpv17 n=1 Tax=Ananas comosus TaxID=4615 RepID=A0A199V0E0_ANACO|nr:Protein Mpv17 [Ananas comosus]